MRLSTFQYQHFKVTDLTIAIPSYLASINLTFTPFNASKTMPHALYSKRKRLTIYLLFWHNFTGFPYKNAYCISLTPFATSASTMQPLTIWPAYSIPINPHVPSALPLTLSHLKLHVLNSIRMAHVPSLSLVHFLGTISHSQSASNLLSPPLRRP